MTPGNSTSTVNTDEDPLSHHHHLHGFGHDPIHCACTGVSRFMTCLLDLHQGLNPKRCGCRRAKTRVCAGTQGFVCKPQGGNANHRPRVMTFYPPASLPEDSRRRDGQPKTTSRFSTSSYWCLSSLILGAWRLCLTTSQRYASESFGSRQASLPCPLYAHPSSPTRCF